MPEQIEEIEQVRERIARAIYKQGGYCGNCSFEGWDSCAECRQTLLSYAVAVLDVLGLERVHWSEHHGGYLYRLAATEEIEMPRYCPACSGHGTRIHECNDLLSVVVRASDLRHLLDVYIENGMVEDEDVEVIDRLWGATAAALPGRKDQS